MGGNSGKWGVGPCGEKGGRVEVPSTDWSGRVHVEAGEEILECKSLDRKLLQHGALGILKENL